MFFKSRHLKLEGHFKAINLYSLDCNNLDLFGITNCELLNIEDAYINNLSVYNVNIKQLNVVGNNNILKKLNYHSIINTLCKGKLVNDEINFNDTIISKDLHLYFHDIESKSLNFNNVINNGALIFTNIQIGTSQNIGNFTFKNSDLGKTIFMNCSFINSKVDFTSSKINEIFLANTEFPNINNENYISTTDNN